MAGGFHCVRRSNRFWAGLSTDLVIEQVMMKAIKSRGWTDARSRHDRKRSIDMDWQHASMCKCPSSYHFLLGIDYASHDSQHVELGKKSHGSRPDGCNKTV